MTHPDNDMEMSPSWSRAHDWKSCNRQKRFESSNLSISAKEKPAEMRVFPLFMRVFRLFTLCAYCLFFARFCVSRAQKNTGKYSKISLLGGGGFFYHTLSETPSASYKRCFCFVVALGTALSIASFFLRLAELAIVLPFSPLSPTIPRAAKYAA